MAIIKMHYLAVMKRFPAHEAIIKRLYREDEKFQSICEDYGSCCEALRGWSESPSEEAPARKREYAELLQDLEQEILRYLFEHKQSEK